MNMFTLGEGGELHIVFLSFFPYHEVQRQVQRRKICPAIPQKMENEALND
jgi:hypothetical protein